MNETLKGITKIVPAGMWLFFLIGILVAIFVHDSYTLRLLIVALFFGAMAMCFDFTAGLMNVFNMGLACFMGVGAYASAIITNNLGLSPWLGLIPALIISGILGCLVGLLTMRLRGMFVAIMTWFLAMVIKAIDTAAVGLTRGNLGLHVKYLFGVADRRSYFILILILTFIVFAIIRYVKYSDMGTAFRAVGMNVDLALSSGINYNKYKVLNFTIACMMLGALGWFYGHFIGILNPAVLTNVLTFQVMAMAVIGGLGSVWGGLIVAVLLYPTMESLRSLEELRLILYGLLLVIVTIFAPGGIASVIEFVAPKRLLAYIRKKRQNKDSADGGGNSEQNTAQQSL